MPEKIAPDLAPDVAAACGDYAALGFEPRRYRGTNGLMLVVDDNFKLFCVPHPKTMDYVLLGPNGRIASRGLVVNRPGGDSFVLAVQGAEDYLSKTGTMHTYASINLKAKTGVGPYTGRSMDAAVRDFIAFEQETSAVYPFAVQEPSDDQIREIAARCASDDTEAIYEACEKVLGTAPMLKEEGE